MYCSFTEFNVSTIFVMDKSKNLSISVKKCVCICLVTKKKCYIHKILNCEMNHANKLACFLGYKRQTAEPIRI